MWAQSDQPSLVAVAQQRSASKAKRVVTNDEIPPSPEANNPPAPVATPASPKKGPGKDGDKSAKSAEKPTALQQLMAEHDSLEKIIKQMQEKIDASNDRDRTASLSEVMLEAKQALAENQQKIDKLKASEAASGSSDVAPAATNAPSTAEQGRPR